MKTYQNAIGPILLKKYISTEQGEEYNGKPRSSTKFRAGILPVERRRTF